MEYATWSMMRIIDWTIIAVWMAWLTKEALHARDFRKIVQSAPKPK